MSDNGEAAYKMGDRIRVKTTAEELTVSFYDTKCFPPIGVAENSNLYKPDDVELVETYAARARASVEQAARNKIREYAQSALDSQSACNLSGIIHSWSRILGFLWEYSRIFNKPGTEWVNNHPINVLFITQACHLSGAGLPSGDRYFKAHEHCEILAKGEEIDY